MVALLYTPVPSQCTIEGCVLYGDGSNAWELHVPLKLCQYTMFYNCSHINYNGSPVMFLPGIRAGIVKQTESGHQEWLPTGSHPLTKISFCLVFFNLALTRPPCFLESFEELIFKPDFIRYKVPQSVWTLVIPPNLPWKRSMSKQKMFFIIFGIR